MLTRSRYRAAMSADPGGGGRGGMEREGRQARRRRTGAAAVAAATENLMGNSGPKVGAAAVIVEAVEEVDGVKVEGRVVEEVDAVVITDAGTDGDEGLAMVSDFLCVTEAAGMVGAEIDEDGSGENVQLKNGGGGGGMQGKLGIEAIGLQSEEEAAAKIVEWSAYHTPQHVEAGPNKNDHFAKYCLPCLDNGDIQASDLVWGKLEGYPWWPGEIFNSSDASELALKHRIRGSHLVVFFGDSTFAWCDESQLMPFMTNYAQMEKQSTSDEFVNAVNQALEELSRRILIGMSYPCSPEELSDSAMPYLVENHGLREGVMCSAANRAEVLKCFRPEHLLHYVKSLALFPGQGGDLLELVIACSQLTSFYHFKGNPELATFQTANGWAENAMYAPSTKNIEEDVTSVVHSNHYKPSKAIGRPCKRKPEDGIKLMEKKATSNMYNSCSYDHSGKTQMAGSVGELKPKKDRNRTNVHSPTHDSYLSELSLHDDPICSLKRASTRTNPTHKRRSSLEKYVPSSQQLQSATLPPKKQIQVMERPIIHVNAKLSHEVNPTALVLSFGRSAALPSETYLIKMFRHYGPLKQTETEVHKGTNTVKVVFKKRADAERAFRVVGNYCTFGPWLQSYRLVNMPFSLGMLEATSK
ncbi:unnamed protein product [Urochloa decumbens]|uniref:PWWP domain-containing protein n=1 Tax=Urochloa decumbens TaxID=240449 RepID=A0ABC8VNN5_9POAL